MGIARIGALIYVVRGQRVLLDRDLAALYGVSTGALNQAVRRNPERFPDDFMFRLTLAEMRNWVSQSVIPNPSLKMSLRLLPCAFTEQGVAMLSGVLKSERAVRVNVEIMRAFVGLRRALGANKKLAERVEKVERRLETHEGRSKACSRRSKGWRLLRVDRGGASGLPATRGREKLEVAIRDLARLYGVTTSQLNQQFRRNRRRFPGDFAFTLTRKEASAGLSQIVTALGGRNRSKPPIAYTEHGAIMAANVLKSDCATAMSVEVVRAFVRLRRMSSSRSLS